MPFVIGIEIKLSNNHTCKGVIGRFVDICDDLAGVYPKEFKFVGWHPHCRCFTIAKMASAEECNDYFDRREAGEDVSNYQFSGKVKELPQNFQNWHTDNADRIAKAKSQPYFLRDNAKLISGAERVGYGSNVPFGLNTLQQREWINNEHDVIDVLGEQGYPMTHKQANGNMPNPNYDKNTSDMYSKNCQSCVVAYELRRRGYDVEALNWR